MWVSDSVICQSFMCIYTSAWSWTVLNKRCFDICNFVWFITVDWLNMYVSAEWVSETGIVVYECSGISMICLIVLWKTLPSTSQSHMWLVKRAATYCPAVPTCLCTTRNAWFSVHSWALVSQCCCWPERFRNICVNMPVKSLLATCQSMHYYCLYVFERLLCKKQ